jgi:transcriptional regulator with XRE-family HTH domain
MRYSVDGKKLAVLRSGKFLSRNELAKRADLQPSAVQRIEQTGTTTVRATTLRKLAAGMGMKTEELEERLRPSVTPVTPIYVDADTHARLAHMAAEAGESIEQLVAAWALASTREVTPIVQSAQPAGSARMKSVEAPVTK